MGDTSGQSKQNHLKESEGVSCCSPRGVLPPVIARRARSVETREIVRARAYRPPGQGGKTGADDKSEEDELEDAEAVTQPYAPARSKGVNQANG
jgi:hypothetical protein